MDVIFTAKVTKENKVKIFSGFFVYVVVKKIVPQNTQILQLRNEQVKCYGIY